MFWHEVLLMMFGFNGGRSLVGLSRLLQTVSESYVGEGGILKSRCDKKYKDTKCEDESKMRTVTM